MAWIPNEKARDKYIRLMAKHFNRDEAELRKEVEQYPERLEGFVDYLDDGGKVSL